MLALKTAPAFEPMDIATFKTAWHVDFGEDDAQITRAAIAARKYVEGYLHRAIITRSYYLYLRDFPSGRVIRLPYPPLSSVTAITYTASDASAFGTTYAASNYSVETWREPGRIVLLDTATWPSTYGDGIRDEVRIEFVAGASTTAAGLETAQKHDWLHALVTVGRDFYENPTWHLMEANYKNESVEALLWHDRFLGEVDGLEVDGS